MSDTPAVLEKIKRLRKEFSVEGDPAAKATINQMEVAVKKAMVLDDLMKHDGFKQLLELLKERFQGANYLLANDRTLDEKQRETLFNQKENAIWLIDIFKVERSVIEDVEEEVDSNLEE
ncbi:MAG TPA: hypothetical protein ENI13_02090 [candidate division CPR3 bacterium]|uniref:Uncharacterized protein n=1 Tax=candidate division CPR3 bacterium TaxID=2268181 RepID=A0A7C1P5U1_UNCC3|nr:hypothetical protein [candidate division CPR3 bacterium]